MLAIFWRMRGEIQQSGTVTPAYDKYDSGIFGRLAGRIPEGTVKIAESGVRRPRDLLAYAASGADAVLVGESLVTEKGPGCAVADLVTAVRIPPCEENLVDLHGHRPHSAR